MLTAARGPETNELIIADSIVIDMLSEPRAGVVIAQRVVCEAAQFHHHVQATNAMMFSLQGGIRYGSLLLSDFCVIHESSERSS